MEKSKLKKYLLKVECEYEVYAEDEDEVNNVLEETIARNNSTPENEFWDNMNIEEIK